MGYSLILASSNQQRILEVNELPEILVLQGSNSVVQLLNFILIVSSVPIRPRYRTPFAEARLLDDIESSLLV